MNKPSARRVPRWARGDYAQDLEKIRRYVPKSFIYAKPTRRHRAKVQATIDYIFGTADEPRAYSADKRAYKPKRADYLKAAQDASGLPPGFEHLNVAFIDDLGPGQRVRILKSGDLRISVGKIQRDVRFFNQSAVIAAAADDAALESFIEQARRMTQPDPPGTMYQILCGDHKYGGEGGTAMGLDELEDTLRRLFDKYHDTIGKWLRGIAIYAFKGQEGLEGFDEAFATAEFERIMGGVETRTESRRRGKKKHRKVEEFP